MDRGHDHRGAGRNRRARPDHLRAEHVGVDEVDLLAPQPGHELADGDLVIGRVEDLDRDAQRSEALHRRAGREREGADLVSRSVEAEQQAGVALLRAAVAAGRQQLEHARARMAAGPMDPPMAGVRGAGDGALVIGLCHVADAANQLRMRIEAVFVANPRSPMLVAAAPPQTSSRGKSSAVATRIAIVARSTPPFNTSTDARPPD